MYFTTGISQARGFPHPLPNTTQGIYTALRWLKIASLIYSRLSSVPDSMYRAPCISAVSHFCPEVPAATALLTVADCGRGATRVRPIFPLVPRLLPLLLPPLLGLRFVVEVITTAGPTLNLFDTAVTARAVAVRAASEMAIC